MGFIEQLVGLLQGPQNSSREHVVNLLKTFVMDYPPGISECHRTEFDLERLLSSIITSSMEDDPDLHEVKIAIIAQRSIFFLVCNNSNSFFSALYVKCEIEYPMVR